MHKIVSKKIILLALLTGLGLTIPGCQNVSTDKCEMCTYNGNDDENEDHYIKHLINYLNELNKLNIKEAKILTSDFNINNLNDLKNSILEYKKGKLENKIYLSKAKLYITNYLNNYATEAVLFNSKCVIEDALKKYYDLSTNKNLSFDIITYNDCYYISSKIEKTHYYTYSYDIDDKELYNFIDTYYKLYNLYNNDKNNNNNNEINKLILKNIEYQDVISNKIDNNNIKVNALTKAINN